MATATDSFTDTNGVLLENHTSPEDGTTWTKHGSYATGVVTIHNNAIYPGQPAWVFYNSWTPASAEYSVEVVLDYVTEDDNHFAGVAARIATGADTFYRLLCHGRPVSNPNIGLRKIVAGTSTLLASDTTTVLADNDVVELECLNATKKVYVNGVEKLSSTDNTITAAGKAGVVGQGPNAATTTAGLHLKGWTATDAGGATVTGDVTDDIKLQDSYDAAATRPADVTDNIKLQDSAEASATRPAEITDDITLQDAVTAALVLTAELTDNIKLLDAVTGAVTRALSAEASDIKLRDSFTAEVLQIITAAITDDIKLQDSVEADVILGGQVEDLIILQDTLEAVLTLRAAVTDNIKLTDTQAARLTARSAMIGEVTLADSYNAVATLRSAKTDNIVFGDAFTATVIPAVVGTAPPRRTCTIAAPDRTCVIPSRSRTMTVQ